jgi:hypothetical protein
VRVLLVEETRVPRENHWQILSHNVVISKPPPPECKNIRTYSMSCEKYDGKTPQT